MFVGVLVVTLVAALFLTACGETAPTPTPIPTPTATPAPTATHTPLPTATATPSPRSLILGTWKEVNGSETLRFFANGTFALTNPNLLVTDAEGTYEFVATATVRVKMPTLFGTQTNFYDVQFGRDRMLMKNSQGVITEYQLQR